jgi:nitrogen fixation-related uncharacterized protein
MTTPDALLTMWITFTVLACAGVCAVLVWAVRSGQFSDQNRARSLPLASGIPAAGEDSLPSRGLFSPPLAGPSESPARSPDARRSIAGGPHVPS